MNYYKNYTKEYIYYMGAIQNSITAALGAITGAAVAGKHMKDIKAKEEEQGLLAKEQYHEAAADIKGLQEQLSSKKNEWGEAEGDLAILNAKRTGGKGNTKAALDEKKKAKMSEIDAAKRAFEELSDRIEAKKAMKQRAEIMMSKANKWGGIK